MATSPRIRHVVITGAKGNLGRKLAPHLLERRICETITGIDRADGPTTSLAEGVTLVEADLANPADERWRQALRGADAVFHFAAQNPYPDSAWDDACASFDMTLHVVEAAAANGVSRVIFASSNHVMGQYKDAPLADRLSPGGLTPDLVPGPGTRWFNGRKVVQGTAYAVSKLMGERLCVAKANLSGGALSSVSVRIGWCQPGDNRPDTLSATGIPQDSGVEHPDTERDLRWFRNMWLSNRDFCEVMERALLADASGWDAPGIVVNGMSRNSGMAWSLAEGARLLGYSPRDDAWKELSLKAAGV